MADLNQENIALQEILYRGHYVLWAVNMAVIITVSIYDLMFLQNCLVISQAANILGFIFIQGTFKRGMNHDLPLRNCLQSWTV